MTLEVEATYEGGVLKPAQPLPLREHQRVIITVREEAPQARISYGLIPWRGDPEALRGIAEDPELRVLAVPMNFLDLPEGESVFIDANVFVYAFAADPTLGPPCRDLMAA